MGDVMMSGEEVEVVKTESETEAAEGGGSEGRSNRDGLVKWEKFLPKIALRVLLVEADDSTRHIIAALLRKCSYRVAAVPDGLKAWEILKARSHDIDLILTEVDLPSISGYALLTLITEHEICSNIPVIMMSSHDSVSTVYKCMLRGAADYLVKPLRRNELRNLWQHVWRRQSSQAFGNFPREESVGQQKLEATSENNSTTNKEQIEKGPDAESSYTKPDKEAEITDIENNTQDFSQKKRDKSLLNDAKGKEAEPRKICGAVDNATVNDLNGDADSAYYEQGVASKEAIDFMGPFFRTNECTRNDGTSKFDSRLELDLSLRRSKPFALENQSSGERPVLRLSNASAFTRYVNRPIQTQSLMSPGMYGQKKEDGTNHNNNNTSDLAAFPNANSPGPPPRPPPNIPASWFHQNSYPTPFPVKGIRFNNNTGNNDNYLDAAYGSGTPPSFITQSSPCPMPSPSSVSPQEFTSRLRPFHIPTWENNKTEYLSYQVGNNKSDHRLNSLDEIRDHASPAVEQNRVGGFCNGVYYGASGSGGNGNGDHHVAAGPSADLENRNEDALCAPTGKCHRSLQREAALTKFRMKRKDRCFEKKVRYESRKKLAEQRPRVKGQFVRQVQPPEAAQDNYDYSTDV